MGRNLMKTFSSLLLVFLIPLISSCSSSKIEVNPAYNYVAEGRGTWISSSKRVNWDSTMAALSEAGFNMVFPYACSAGAAFYPSEFVPMVSERDELKLCVEAAHRHGIEVHALKVNWQMENTPDEFNQEMIQAGRIQYAPDGRRSTEVAASYGWPRKGESLCPSQEANRQLELDLMLEMVKKYDVDGVNFDYMRYEFEPLCYCDKCRENFTRETGLELKWPDDVWKGGKYRELYLDWRRYLIHSSAREIARAVHTYDPYACVSICARRQLIQHVYESDAQVWWEWIKEGILDFVTPMNYSDDPEGYIGFIKQQFPLIKGALPYYGGVGVFRMKKFEPVKKAIELGRGIGEDGYNTFNIRTLLPLLEQFKSAGVNSPPALLPHRAPETRFYVESSGRESEEGFQIYSPDSEVSFKVDVMFRAKLREGISRIQGDIVLQKTNGEIVTKISTIDLDKAAIISLSTKCGEQGLYRLALYGAMTLSTGEVKPFITKSFPFQVRVS